MTPRTLADRREGRVGAPLLHLPECGANKIAGGAVLPTGDKLVHPGGERRSEGDVAGVLDGHAEPLAHPGLAVSQDRHLRARDKPGVERGWRAWTLSYPPTFGR